MEKIVLLVIDKHQRAFHKAFETSYGIEAYKHVEFAKFFVKGWQLRQVKVLQRIFGLQGIRQVHGFW